MKYPKKDYVFVRFQKSKNPKKKYDAILKNKLTKKIVRVPFGSVGYEQYNDITGLGLYSKFNHFDKQRRANYRKRSLHNIDPNYYSAALFAFYKLW